jgi:hypothetical protein
VEGHDKASKRGRLALHFRNGAWSTERTRRGAEDKEDHLRPVFRNGEILATQSVAQVREKANSQERMLTIA